MSYKLIRVRARLLNRPAWEIFDIRITQEEFDGIPFGERFTVISDYLQPLVEKYAHEAVLPGSVEYQGLVSEIYAKHNLIPDSQICVAGVQ